MSIAKKLMTTGKSDPTYVDDVFSTYLYTGTGADQDIVNGVDLAGEGGLVWIKIRDGSSNHILQDSEATTANNYLSSDSSNAMRDCSGFHLKSFNDDGFTLESGGTGSNSTVFNYTSWTFRKAPSFFDVVTYTGTGDTTGGSPTHRNIPHNLGVAPGMIITKRLDGAQNWYTWHRGVADDSAYFASTGFINLTADFGGYQGFATNANQTSTHFAVRQNSDTVDQTNALGATYVAYVFAHDDSDESMIKCGSYTGTGAAGNEIYLGFEPQWVMLKSATGSHGWVMHDTMRGWTADGKPIARLRADIANEEYNDANYTEVAVTPTGFRMTDTHASTNSSGEEYIYMAIRRPNKPAEEFEADDVFAIDSASSPSPLPAFTSGFPVDLSIHRQPVGGTSNWFVGSRLIQERRLFTNAADPESSDSTLVYDYPDGYSSGSLTNYHSYMWRRAQGFFDVVAYEGDGQAGREVPHNLGVKPEMIWVKQRNYTDVWYVYAEALGNDRGLYLNEDSAAASNGAWNNTDPDELTFTVAGTNGVNHNSYPMIAYLFASVPGISKVGSYTGTGASIDIDCGFATGARFVLIKRADGASGNWYVFDVELGITSPDAPFLKLDQTNAVSSGYNNLSPFSGGFTVNHAGANLSASGSEYIFYAIA